MTAPRRAATPPAGVLVPHLKSQLADQRLRVHALEGALAAARGRLATLQSEYDHACVFSECKTIPPMPGTTPDRSNDWAEFLNNTERDDSRHDQWEKPW